MLLNIPGPEAFAQGAAVVRAIPAGRVNAPVGSLGAISSPALPSGAAGAPVRFEASSLASLPGLGAPTLPQQDSGQVLPGSADALPLSALPEAKVPAESKARSFLGLFRRSSDEDGPKLKELKKRLAKEERKAAEKEQRQRAEEQKLIDSVLDISIALEKAENDGNVSDEELRKTADQAWGLDAGPAVLPAVETSEAVGQERTRVVASEVKEEPKARGPPAPLTEAPAKPAALGRVVAKTLQGVSATVHAAAKAVSSVASPLSRIWTSLPSGARVPLAAALTFGVDVSARILMPAVFGFVPAAGLWVTLGLGGVVIPALILTRQNLVKRSDPSLAPLVRYVDLLLGVLLGAAAVTVSGVIGLDLGTAFLEAAHKGGGLVSLAPLMGVFGFMASLPVLYGAGHVAWGLKNKTATDPDLPLPWMFKLMLLSAIVTPIAAFLFLSGGLPFSMLIFYEAISSYFRSRSKLAAMTVPQGEEDAEVVWYEEDWRLDLMEGPATTPAEQLKKAAVQAALWGAGIVLGSLGMLSLFFLPPAAALDYAATHILSSLWTLIPFGLAGGFLAALFMKVKKAAPGPYVDTVRELADKAGLPMPSVKAGKTPGDPNAFAAGALHHLAVVAVVGTITRLMTVREMRGILGHELSHVKYRHMLSFLFAIPFLQLVSISGESVFQMALAYWAPILWVLALLGLTRANERMADAGGALVTNDPRGLATGLRKLALMGMASDMMPHREGSWLYRLFLSHPDPHERVETLARMLKSGSK
jgi:heat shock protein HtpX